MAMQSFQELGRELERQGMTERIKALAESDDGQRLGRMVDTHAVEEAARTGDADALRRMLTQVLSTDEGKRLAENVRRMMQEK